MEYCIDKTKQHSLPKTIGTMNNRYPLLKIHRNLVVEHPEELLDRNLPNSPRDLLLFCRCHFFPMKQETAERVPFQLSGGFPREGYATQNILDFKYGRTCQMVGPSVICGPFMKIEASRGKTPIP